MDGAIRRAKSRWCRRGCLFICLPCVSCLKECGEDERRDEHPLGTLFGCPAVQGCWPRAAAAPRSPLVGSCPHCKPPGGRSDRRAASSSRRVEVKTSRGFIKGAEKLSGLCPNMSYFAPASSESSGCWSALQRALVGRELQPGKSTQVLM